MFGRRGGVVGAGDSRSRLELTSLVRQKPPRRFGAAKTDVISPNQRIFLRQGFDPGISHIHGQKKLQRISSPKYLWYLSYSRINTVQHAVPLLFLGVLQFTPHQMTSHQPLPLPPQFTTVDAYIASLLTFSQNPLFQTLCGGVHILDFFTRDLPDTSSSQAQDLYHTILPAEWISYFSTRSIDDVLELILRVKPSDIDPNCPESLTSFIAEVRSHSLRREFVKKERVRKAVRKSMGAGRKDGEEWALNAGMKPKKIHEVCSSCSYLYLYNSKNAMDVFLPTKVPFSYRLRTSPNSSTTSSPT